MPLESLSTSSLLLLCTNKRPEEVGAVVADLSEVKGETEVSGAKFQVTAV